MIGRMYSTYIGYYSGRGYVHPFLPYPYNRSLRSLASSRTWCFKSIYTVRQTPLTGFVNYDNTMVKASANTFINNIIIDLKVYLHKEIIIFKITSSFRPVNKLLSAANLYEIL